ncbi:hypothetical protein BGZ73_001254 [Actinomortierella ambigua]|nr:hypothetical protein BGZ73_001254 [Actinomortierella ambigua]
MTVLTYLLFADTTPPRDRGLMIGLWEIGSVFNIFVAQSLIDFLTLNWSWRWVYLIAGIVATIGAMTVLTPLWHLERKQPALKDDEIERQEDEEEPPSPHHLSRRSSYEHADQLPPHHHPRRSFTGFLSEFDAMALFPLTLAHTFPGNYTNAWIVSSFTAGLICLAFFAYYEAHLTQRPPILPCRLWASNTTFSAALIVQAVVTFMDSLNWQYLTLYLVVSHDLTFGQAVLLERAYQLAYLAVALVTGFALKHSA